MGRARFDARKQLVIEEAKALETAYLRADLLPEARKKEIHNIEQVLTRSEELHTLLWEQAVALGKDSGNAFVNGLFIQSLNEVIDLHPKRLTTGILNRIPTSSLITPNAMIQPIRYPVAPLLP